MGAVAAKLAVVAKLELTDQEQILVRRGQAAIQRGYHEMMELGRALSELKAITTHGRFGAIVQEHFGLSRDLAAMWMRITDHKPFENVAISLHLPASPYARDELRKLPEADLQREVDSGRVSRAMTVQNATELVQEIGRQVDASKPGPHRPVAAASPAPCAPAIDGIASSYAELVWMLRERRKELGLTHLEVDERAGFQEGYTGKLEQPNSLYGRSAVHPSFDPWLGALGLGIQIVEIKKPAKGWKRERIAG